MLALPLMVMVLPLSLISEFVRVNVFDIFGIELGVALERKMIR